MVGNALGLLDHASAQLVPSAFTVNLAFVVIGNRVSQLQVGISGNTGDEQIRLVAGLRRYETPGSAFGFFASQRSNSAGQPTDKIGIDWKGSVGRPRISG